MKHLPSARKGQDFVSLSPYLLKGGDGQDGTNPLSSAKKAVPHGLVKRGWEIRFPALLCPVGQIVLQSSIHDLFFLLEIFFDIHHFGNNFFITGVTPVAMRILNPKHEKTLNPKHKTLNKLKTQTKILKIFVLDFKL